MERHRALRVRMAPELPPGLLEHIDRVVATAEPLARRHGLDVARTLLAAQAHDLLRAAAPAALLALAEARGLPIDPAERAEPLLLHGPLAALELADRGWVTDFDVLNAVRYHTTGHPDLTPEAWCCFVADKVEPEKLRYWPALHAVAELADESLELAALAYLDLNRSRARREGWAIHPLAEAARRSLRRRIAIQHR